jgi:hypothetical protein
MRTETDPVSETCFLVLEYWTMGKVRKPSDPVGAPDLALESYLPATQNCQRCSLKFVGLVRNGSIEMYVGENLPY